jgi:hypothetical protein
MKALVQTLKITALLVGVTAFGLFAGAWLMSPALSPRQRLLAAGGVIGTLVVAAVGAWLRGVLMNRRTRRTRTAAAAAPVITLRSGRVSRTPKAVQALAASGAAPMDIAHRTGLPLDAVSMLLELAPAR